MVFLGINFFCLFSRQNEGEKSFFGFLAFSVFSVFRFFFLRKIRVTKSTLFLSPSSKRIKEHTHTQKHTQKKSARAHHSLDIQRRREVLSRTHAGKSLLSLRIQHERQWKQRRRKKRRRKRLRLPTPSPPHFF